MALNPAASDPTAPNPTASDPTAPDSLSAAEPGYEQDWHAWHTAYDEPRSPLAQRLAVVQARITDALDAAPAGPLRVISMCAGQGRDLIPVLARHPRGPDVSARLVELDPALAATARQRAADHRLPGVEVVTGDAALTGAYTGLVPADLVLACGVFGNVPDADIKRTVRCCGQLCAEGGTVVWTRGRMAPDKVPLICDWFGEQGFELRWLSVPWVRYGVGMHRHTRQPGLLAAGLRMFSFTGPD